jgi:hypothetical protein
MKNSTLLLIFGAIVLILFIMRKSIDKSLSRGYRNNNPGNIRLTYDSKGNKTYWNGEVDGSDKSFKTFIDMEHGYRAMFITLRSYLDKGFDNITKIINRYAPADDNNVPEAYIKTVEKNSGVDKTDTLTITDSEKLQRIVAAMSGVENGITADVSQVKAGYNLFIKS